MCGIGELEYKQDLMTTLIRVKGWVTESRVIHPMRSYVKEQDIYTFRIQPELSSIYEEIEEQLLKIRDAKKEEYKLQDPLTTYVKHRDILFDGCEICFETFHKPKLVEGLEAYEHDDELLGKFVQVVGHIQIMPDLNAFLSVHIIEPALTADFDPIE